MTSVLTCPDKDKLVLSRCKKIDQKSLLVEQVSEGIVAHPFFLKCSSNSLELRPHCFFSLKSFLCCAGF